MNAVVNLVYSPRVLLVEDSAVEMAIIKKILEDGGITVVGTAMNGVEALERIAQLDPDVICTDYHMPEMDGLALTEKVMEKYPRPILVLSISAQAYQKHNIMNILKAGALDVMAKPIGGNSDYGERDAMRLVEKIKILAGVKVLTNHKKKVNPVAKPICIDADCYQKLPEIIGIGASTGGPQALLSIISQLPENFAIPIVCVQHISAGFLGGLVEWLNENARLRVVVAEVGMRPHGGYVYLAPENQHLVLDHDKRFQLLPAHANDIHLPSIDCLFESLAVVYGDSSVGVLLSGMGSDGAQGMVSIHRHGGLTIAQDEDSSIIFGMPKAAIDAGAVVEVLPLQAVSERLLKLQTLS